MIPMGVVAVINPTDANEMPLKWGRFGPETGASGTLSLPSNSRLACTLGDLNGDGRKDLIVATGMRVKSESPVWS